MYLSPTDRNTEPLIKVGKTRITSTCKSQKERWKNQVASHECISTTLCDPFYSQNEVFFLTKRQESNLIEEIDPIISENQIPETNVYVNVRLELKVSRRSLDIFSREKYVHLL